MRGCRRSAARRSAQAARAAVGGNLCRACECPPRAVYCNGEGLPSSGHRRGCARCVDKRGRSPWPPSTNECYLRSSGDLVNRRVGDFIGLKLRSPLDELSQRLQLLLIARAAVGLRVLPRLPEADRDRFRSARVEERHFVLEALLLPKYGKYFLLEGLGELRGAVGLELHADISSEHFRLRAADG